VEHGGHGGVTAAPIAKHVLETFFAKQEGRPLPPLDTKGWVVETPAPDNDDPPVMPAPVPGATPTDRPTVAGHN